MELSNKQLVVLALVAGIILGVGVGGIGGFFFGVQQVSSYVGENLDELCSENALAPQMRADFSIADGDLNV